MKISIEIKPNIIAPSIKILLSLFLLSETLRIYYETNKTVELFYIAMISSAFLLWAIYDLLALFWID